MLVAAKTGEDTENNEEEQFYQWKLKEQFVSKILRKRNRSSDKKEKGKSERREAARHCTWLE